MLNINGPARFWGQRQTALFICILHTSYEEPIEIYMSPSTVFSPSKKMTFLTQTSYFLLKFYAHPYTQSNKIALFIPSQKLMFFPVKFINLNSWGLINSATAAVIAWEETGTYTWIQFSAQQHYLAIQV